MLVTRNLQPSLWESVLPDEVRRLSPLLERVDRWLDDEAFCAPFRPFFSALLGRPSIPMEVYLWMMFFEVPVPVGVRVAVSGGGRLDLVADLLPAQPR